ncbi:MAG: HAMP domain-containing histidine kinase [Myxococcales bacterium]|nr:HAMP domain-containing histidine kinase [Myxococcales bacterium]
MRRLHSRIYLHFLGVLLVAGMASGVVFATGWRSAFVHGMARRLALHAASAIGERFGDQAARQALVRRLAVDLDIDLTVRDVAGQPLDVVGQALPLPSPEQVQAIRAGPSDVLPGPRGWYAAAPIRDEGGTLRGIVQVSVVQRFRMRSEWRPLGALVLLLVIVALATAPLARRISRPVMRLTEASRRFGGGDLAVRIPVPGGPDGPACGPRRPHRRHHRPDELEELTRAWNDMAERVEGLVRTQKELLANVSHELRSPLARLRMALELLPQGEGTEARVRDIEGDIGELDRLIDDVLTMSRIDAAALPLHLDRVDTQALCAQLAERAGHDPAVAGIAVRAVGGPRLELEADAALLRRALWNLVENAAKYGAPPIVLAAARREESLELTVTDEGAGIAAADRERVFQPFYRAVRTSGDAGAARGYGLGLALARRVAEVHGGTIRAEAARVEGDREIGCRIVLTIPLRG